MKDGDLVRQAASLLGKRGAGCPKNFSKAERELRAERMKLLNAARREARKVCKLGGKE